IYRAVGLKLIYSGKDPYDKRSAIDSALALSEQDLTNPRLRQERIGQAASIISSIPEVRSILLDFQRNFAKSPKGAVLDGRDIGTVVCPQADIKIFITANLETRAKRRHRELQGEGIEVVYQSVVDDLHERDERDAERNVAPLIAAEDSIIVDSSDLSANEVFDKVVAIVKNKLGKI
ncbi:MAG: (d)CMP kinase, partial [Pseudomonadota bacterium]